MATLQCNTVSHFLCVLSAAFSGDSPQRCFAFFVEAVIACKEGDLQNLLARSFLFIFFVKTENTFETSKKKAIKKYYEYICVERFLLSLAFPKSRNVVRRRPFGRRAVGPFRTSRRGTATRSRRPGEERKRRE